MEWLVQRFGIQIQRATIARGGYEMALLKRAVERDFLRVTSGNGETFERDTLRQYPCVLRSG